MRRPPTRRRAWPLVAAVILVGVVFLAVFPTRTYLSQRWDLSNTERRLAVLSRQNAELSARVARLNTDAEIERLAREQYNLVRPGEEAFAILPPQAGAPAPAREEEPRPSAPAGLWAELWDRVTFWS
ncbi:MAG: septum formation initiator family protein [Actinomycetota bacterium]|nr:septum formation initiator family protein [Actinomycetota bacterium]MDQ3575683.1 septum formation initiator family protein [Actinomycetota bacterium]